MFVYIVYNVFYDTHRLEGWQHNDGYIQGMLDQNGQIAYIKVKNNLLSAKLLILVRYLDWLIDIKIDQILPDLCMIEFILNSM